MRIGYTADLHNGITPFSMLREFAQDVNSRELDILLIGGDIGECVKSTRLFKEALNLFHAKNKVLVVAGNHDLWVKPEDVISRGKANSRQLFDTVLPQITREANAFWLETENYIVGDTAFVGSYLHYDYSAKDTTGHLGTLTDDYYWVNKPSVMIDGSYFVEMPTDIEFANEISEKFRQRIFEAENNPAINRIVISTHVPCCPCQVTRKPGDHRWNIGTAYFGNISSWEVMRCSKKISHIFSAHSHAGNRNEVQAEDGHVMDIVNLDADYRSPKCVVIET